MPWREEPTKPVTPRAAANAKSLRRNPTEPEGRLWWHLRYRLPVEDSHFQRQVAIGAYVADFCCLAARLVVEVDGGQYSFDRNVPYDAARTTALQAQGYRLLRFTNAEVMTEIDVVLDTIFAALAGAYDPFFTRQPSGTTPTPGPSPQGGGEMLEP